MTRKSIAVALTVLMGLSAFGTLPTRTATITVVNTHDSGSGSLRRAIADANPGDTIVFSLTYPATITLTSGQLAIDKHLSIGGSGAGSLIVSSNNITHVFHIRSGVSATISGIAVVNGHADEGGGVYNEGSLTMTSCAFSGNRVHGDGGGIYNEGQLTVSGCTLSGNRADNDGGGVDNFGGTLTVTDTSFSGNVAGNDSGGLGNTLFSTATVTGCIFSGNSAGNDGGGIDNAWGTLSVADSAFASNSAGNDGGGIYNFGALIVTDGAFSGNSAGNDGGGIATYDVLTMTAVVFSGNSTGNRGGGIANYGTLKLTGSTFSGNRAENDGGGIGNQGDASVVNSTFSSNSAGDGGGLSNVWGELALTNSTFSGNSADMSGGGLYNTYGATATLKNTLVAISTAAGNCSGSMTVGSTKNIATDASCSPGFTQVTPAQLALGTLTGDPAYFPLNPGSVAIDAGTNIGCPPTDQRGVSRPQDGDDNSTVICDVGSYEAIALANTVYLPLTLKK